MEMVSIKTIAAELGVGKDYALRLIKRRGSALGIKPQYGRRNTVSLSREDADRLIEAYKPTRVAAVTVAPTGFGYFYIIQLHPEDLPTRLKVGYTDNLTVRISDHRTSAPTLKLVRSWACKRVWESAAVASITRHGCRLVGGEVYDGDVEGLVRRAEAFFALLPQPRSSEPQSPEKGGA